MVEMHGWVCIVDSLEESDADKTREIAEGLARKFETMDSPLKIKWMDGACYFEAYSPLEIRWMNGACYLQVSLYTNHWRSDCAATLELYHMIAEKAEGSYGVLYVHDDEDKEFGNEFRIYRLARGKVEVFRDTLLSPCIPMLEDAE